MDNFDRANFADGGGLPPSNSDDGKTIPFDDSDPMPAPAAPPASVSRKPLDLGAGKPGAASPAQPAKPGAWVAKPAAKPTAKPAAKPVARPVAKPVAQANPSAVVPTERITGMKIFVIKLHHGSLAFLEEQIAEWLRENPEVVIKRTDVSVGEVQAKKTEPNLIINVWY